MRCRDVERQKDITITIDDLNNQIKRTLNWNSSGPDGVNGYWLKNFDTLHVRIEQQLDEYLHTNKIPNLMIKGRTCLILKDKTKGNILSNIRSMTCPPIMWKIFAGMIGKHMNKHLEDGEFLPPEQKGVQRESRGTKDQLMIDKMVLHNLRRRLTHLAVAWTDYNKVYDMVTCSWTIKCVDWFGIANNIKKMMENSMAQ